MKLTWLILAISVWFNIAFLSFDLYYILSDGSTTVAGRKNEIITKNIGSPGDLCGLHISNRQDRARLKLQAGISRGLYKGPFFNTTLKDLLVVIPARMEADLKALWDAWGKELWENDAIEFFAFDSNPLKEGESEPRIVYKEIQAGKKVRVVVWHGTEKNILNSLSEKVRRHLAYVCSSDDTFYSRRKWILKADTDTLIIPSHLESLLTNYDFNKPQYIGYQFNKGGCHYIGGGGYLMSKATVKILSKLLNVQSNKEWRYEDMMVGCELNSVGIKPQNNKAFYWKRPWQRQIAYGVLAPVVLVHKVKDDASMRDLKAWLDFVLGSSAGIPPISKQS